MESTKSDISCSRSPSPVSNCLPDNHRQANPFSIDYILSNSAVAAAAAVVAKDTSATTNKQTERRLMDEFNLKNQRRAQLMAAASQQHQPISPGRATDLEMQPTASNGPLNIPQINQPYPNFLYFMACMLLQQQQQQQQRQQKQVEQQQQLIAQQLARSQQQPPKIPSNTASPIDSLAVLARLTGTINGPGQTPDGAAASSSAHLNKHPNRLHSNQSFTRHHPYQHQPHQHQQHHSQPIDRSPAPAFMGSTMMHMDLSSGVSKLASGMQINHCLTSASNQLPADAHLSSINACKYHLSDSSSLLSTTTSGVNGTTGSMQCKSPAEKLDNLKPAHSYIGLIGMCILSSPEKRMVLNDIYQFILDNYPYYRNRGSGWRNSVRHNLSLNECFQKAGRAANGKGHYWTIHPANMEDFMMGDFRRRRAQRKVRRWNNMDVPSDESEDESIEDATKPALPDHFKRSLEMHKRLEMGLTFHHKSSGLDGTIDRTEARTPNLLANGLGAPMSLMLNQATTRIKPEHVFGGKQEL